nr:unnamed protein product [Callosobruchus analis]
MEETELEANARRVSILKLKSKSPGGPSLDVTSATKRRVSFSSRNRVKPFAADPDENTIWDNTYEEQADKTDSNASSIDALPNYPETSRNQTEFEIWENLDTTMGGPQSSVSKTVYESMEITDCHLAFKATGQDTILNQSVMELKMTSPAPVNHTHDKTMNQTSTMEFTCQPAGKTEADIMQESMDITKGMLDSFKAYFVSKIPDQLKTNTEETICDTVTMELTGILPAVPIPEVTPQRNIILRDTAFNDSATMDFTKSMLVPQTAQPENETSTSKRSSTKGDYSTSKNIVMPLQCLISSDSVTMHITKSIFIPQTAQPENIAPTPEGPPAAGDYIGSEKSVSDSTSTILPAQCLESSENVHKTTNASSNEMDVSVYPSRSITSEAQEIQSANKNISNLSCDKLGTTYTVAQKLSLGKTYVVGCENLPDRENIPCLQYPCQPVTSEKQHLITPVMDKENRKPLVPVDTNLLKPIVHTNCTSNNLEHDKVSFHEQSVIHNKSNLPEVPNANENETQNTTKGQLQHVQQEETQKNDEQLSIGSHVEQDETLNKNEEQILKEPSVKQDENAKELSITTEGDISGLLQNDLSAEMFMPSQQLNEDNPCNLLNVLYSEKMKPPESSHENSAAISTMSFAYDNSELDTDQLIHAEFPQPVKRFEEMRKEMRDILSNFKLPPLHLQADRVGTEISNTDSDSSVTIPNNPTIEEEENDVVVVRKTVLDKVQEAAKRSIFIRAHVDPDTEIVNTFETDFSAAFDKGVLEPIFHYNAEVLDLKLKHDHVSSVIGEKYDILTFLDYVHMSADEVLKFNGLWVTLQIHYSRSHKIRMTKDYRLDYAKEASKFK